MKAAEQYFPMVGCLLCWVTIQMKAIENNFPVLLLCFKKRWLYDSVNEIDNANECCLALLSYRFSKISSYQKQGY